MAVIPASLKLITSALRRAEELEKDPSDECKAISYYCRYYCVSKGSKLCSNPPSPDENKFFDEQMTILEKLKPSLALSRDTGVELCRNFAMNVFDKADEIDRMGLADKATAKMFYSAGTFFDIMEQFGELEPEVVEKKKYAKWKATEILNAIRAGTKPAPGGYESSIPSGNVSATEANSALDIPAAPTEPPSAAFTTKIPTAPNQHHPSPDYSQHYAPAQPAVVPAVITAASPAAGVPPIVTPASSYNHYTAPPSQYASPPVYNTDPRVKDTIELCQFAIASLNKNDLLKAKQRLQEALKRLE